MSEFDGIQERETGKKKMPIGMTVLFVGLIVFGLSYIYLFTPQTTGWSQIAKYEQQAREKAAVMPEERREHEAAETAEYEKKETLAQGEKLYQEHCAMCHGKNLEGGIGPALTGPAFVYGKFVEDHIKVISKGTPNGMPGFEQQLGSSKIYSVAYYIHAKHK
jgi:cytochrome c oxidase cbb3-type subunit 3